jgi:PhnB protein
VTVFPLDAGKRLSFDARMVQAIPEGFHSVTPYLSLSDAAKAIEFYDVALGAKEIYRLAMPNGRIAHAEIRIGNSIIMLSDENPEWGSRSAKTMGGSPVGLCIYTDDVDALAKRFVAAGGKEIRPLTNQFYGDRSGTFEDPEGYKWTLAQHIEDVTPEEMNARMAKMGG